MSQFEIVYYGLGLISFLVALSALLYHMTGQRNHNINMKAIRLVGESAFMSIEDVANAEIYFKENERVIPKDRYEVAMNLFELRRSILQKQQEQTKDV